ncbi:MAG: hypothetical protein HQ588_05780 [Deltaproteobacteria bacterium]|nr:hypothetical protein [Deltaproteobacteria bacterium]
MATSSIRNELGVDIKQVLSRMGYGTAGVPSARIESLVREYADNICHLIEPSYSHVIRDINSVRGSRVFIEGSVTFRSNVVAGLLKRCQKVAVFVLSTGGRLGEVVRQLSGDGLMVQAAVLDAIGSDAAETLAHVVQDIIAREAEADGLGISQRFSPGYCDWRVSQQKMVFRAMGGDTAGVCLTDGCLMIPQKSISGIIGIGPRDRVESYNPCPTCEKRDCRGRR